MLLSSIVLISTAFIVLGVIAAARAQTLPSISGSILLNGDSLSRFRLTGRQQELAQSQLVDVTGQDFRQAIRVSTRAGAQSEWNVQLCAPTSEAVQSGDVLLARFWMRCTESMTDEGFVGFVYEMAHPEFDKAVEVRLGADSKWKEYFVPFRAARDFPAREARVCLRVGYDRQTIEIGGLQIVNYGTSMKIGDLPRTLVSYAGRSTDAAWRRAALARIEKIRKGDLRVQVLDDCGNAVHAAEVHAVLTRHQFGFGCCVTVENLLDPSPDGDRYRQIVEKNFNLAVFENDMKWQALYGGISPKLDQALQWLQDRQIQVRGHSLFWPSWRWLPSQLKALEREPDQLRAISEKHATEVVSHFKGRLFQWDVVNEPYTNHDLIDLLGGPHVMVDWFKLAHNADPDCRLFLNDYGILEGGPEGAHSKSFFEAIRDLKENGAPIGGIGIQSHFAAALPSPLHLLATLDRFSELGLPIELTELSLNLEDRDLQADYLRDFLIAAFSHQNVHGVMLWGFWEKRHWRPESALWSANWSLRPHGKVWLDLVHKQWQTDQRVRTDSHGNASISGFFGSYDVTVSAGGKTKTVKAILSSDAPTLTILLDRQ